MNKEIMEEFDKQIAGLQRGGFEYPAQYELKAFFKSALDKSREEGRQSGYKDGYEMGKAETLLNLDENGKGQTNNWRETLY